MSDKSAKMYLNTSLTHTASFHQVLWYSSQGFLGANQPTNRGENATSFAEVKVMGQNRNESRLDILHYPPFIFTASFTRPHRPPKGFHLWLSTLIYVDFSSFRLLYPLEWTSPCFSHHLCFACAVAGTKETSCVDVRSWSLRRDAWRGVTTSQSHFIASVQRRLISAGLVIALSGSAVILNAK